MDTSTTIQTLWTLGIIIFILVCASTYLFYAITTKEVTIKGMKEEHKKLTRSINDSTPTTDSNTVGLSNARFQTNEFVAVS